MTTPHTDAPGGVVLALGGGGAAGLAHIGVAQVLSEHGLRVRAVAGTSIGAEIGAFLASGMSPAELDALATQFDWRQTLQLFMPDLPTGGLVSGKNIVDFLESRLGQHRIEELTVGYVAVATDLTSGEQVVIDRGSVVEAVRASISMPGIIQPLAVDGRLLIDGGVVNPVPFDVARERFGGPVVAVAVHSASQEHTLPEPAAAQWPTYVAQLLAQPWMQRAPALRTWLEEYLDNSEQRQPRSPWSIRRILDRALDITQQEVVRQRMRFNPPDLVVTPDVRDIGVLEFYRAREAIDAGRSAALAALPQLQRLAHAD